MSTLFDALQEGDPVANRGLLDFGLALLSSRGNFGRAVGNAGLVGLTGADRYKAQLEAYKRAALNDEILRAQLKSMQDAQAQQATMQEMAGRYYRTPQQQALAQGGGPTVANAQAAQAMPGGFDQQAFIAELTSKYPLIGLEMGQRFARLAPQPIKLGEGDQLLDPATYKPVAANPRAVKAQDMPNAVQEYQFAQSQGYAGTFNDWVKEKASAGAVRISNSVSTEKGYSGALAEGLAKQDLATISAARGAPERIRSSQQVKEILTNQRPITGTAAEQRLAVEKALSTAGLIDGKDVAATENLVSLLASQTLDAIQSSGLGSGQGFTDKDRLFLEKARAGNISINRDTLLYLADMNERAGRASLEKGRAVAKRVRADPNFGIVGDTLEQEIGGGMPTMQDIAAEAERRRRLKGGR